MKYHKLHSEGSKLVLNFKYWIEDNILDFVIAFLLSILIYIFLPDFKSLMYALGVTIDIKNHLFLGVLVGFFFQHITHKLFNDFHLEIFKGQIDDKNYKRDRGMDKEFNDKF